MEKILHFKLRNVTFFFQNSEAVFKDFPLCKATISFLGSLPPIQEKRGRGRDPIRETGGEKDRQSYGFFPPHRGKVGPGLEKKRGRRGTK